MERYASMPELSRKGSMGAAKWRGTLQSGGNGYTCAAAQA